MRYTLRDYKAAEEFLRVYAQEDKSGKMAQIADMLEYSGHLITLERRGENVPDYKERLEFERAQLEERLKRLMEYLEEVKLNGGMPADKDHMTPQQRTWLLSSMEMQKLHMTCYLKALVACMEIEAEAEKRRNENV